MKNTQYQPKTGQPCTCKPGQQRDNCPTCEGTGQQIDFAAIRAKVTPEVSEYDAKAEKFLADNGIRFRATLSNSKTAPWDTGKVSHPHFRVTFSKGKPCTPDYTGNICSASRLAFDFWGGVHDTEATPYSVLACIASDINTPDSFVDFCGEFGESEDSRKALQLFTRCNRFAKRLRAFFTAAEIEALQEIN